MTRAELHRYFIKEFHYCDAATATTEDIFKMELELSTALPQSYTQFMLNHGEAYTPSLLSIIVEDDIDMWDLQNITPIHESIEGTKMYWSGGMPENLIGFGNDSGGNMFCFKRHPQDTNRPDDLSVWIFDHDFVEVERVSDSFDTWLLSFLRLKKTALV